MAHEVTLPVLGESVTEGTVSRWLKKVGDTVTQDEPLLEISTDKVDTEIPAPASGVLLEIRAREDETVAVGAVLAVIGDAAESRPTTATPLADALAPAAPAPAPAASPTGLDIEPSSYVPAVAPREVPDNIGSGTYVTPLVRKLADDYGIDLSAVKGSGVGGRIRKQDILDAAAELGTGPGAGSSTPRHAGPPAPTADAAPAVPPVPAPPPAPQAAPAPAAKPAANDRPADQSHAVPPPPPSWSNAPAGPPPVAHAPGETPAYKPVWTPPAPPATPAVPAPAATTEASAVLSSAPMEPVPARAKDEQPFVTEHKTTEPVAVPKAVSTKDVTKEKVSRLRATIAQRMVESVQTSAQLTATVEVDLTLVSRLRNRVKDEFKARQGVSLTYLAFIAKATIEALEQFPKLNASLDMEAGEITYYNGQHLGIAVDTPRGLLVPVIKDAGDLSVAGLAKKIADLGSRTRANQISPDELSGGTFTITNYGSAGTLMDTPIIYQPQVAILGTGTLTRRPIVVNDARLGEIIAIRDMMYLSLSYDHRLVDGADAARFLSAIKARLEEADFRADF